jgi:hypothetical protein
MTMTEDRFAPRFMTDGQLREWFGLSERAFDRLRATRSLSGKGQAGQQDRPPRRRSFL